MKYNFFIKNPILRYTAVLENNTGDTRYCTTSEKFEYDMKVMLENGYIPLSLFEYAECFYGNKKFEEINKYFTVVFVGYPNDYTIIFSVLKKYNIPASIFLPANDITESESVKLIYHMDLAESQYSVKKRRMILISIERLILILLSPILCL